MRNTMVQQIESSFARDEEYISDVKLHHVEENCGCHLVLSNKRLFVYDNKIGNDEVVFYSIVKVMEIEHTKETIIIRFTDRDPMSFTYITMDNELSMFLQKAAIIVAPIIEEKRQEIEKKVQEKKNRRVRNYLIGFIVLLLISSISVGGTLGYRYYVTKQEEATKAEQQAAEEAARQQILDNINQMTNQVQFTQNYEKRLESYQELLFSLDDALNGIDISDRNMDWDALASTINELSIKFEDITITDEDMVDYNVVINQKEGYIQSKTRIINQNISGVLESTKENISNKFSNDASLLITLKQTVEDSEQLISDLNEDMDSEEALLKTEITTQKASVK